MPVLDSGGLFKDYDLQKVGVLSTGIEEMEALILNYWLSRCNGSSEEVWRKVSSKDCVWHCMRYPEEERN